MRQATANQISLHFRVGRNSSVPNVVAYLPTYSLQQGVACNEQQQDEPCGVLVVLGQANDVELMIFPFTSVTSSTMILCNYLHISVEFCLSKKL